MSGPVTPAGPANAVPAASDAPRSDAFADKHFVDGGGRFVHWCLHPGCRDWGSTGSMFDWRRYCQAVEAGEPDAIRHLGRWYCRGHAPLYRPGTDRPVEGGRLGDGQIKLL